MARDPTVEAFTFAVRPNQLQRYPDAKNQLGPCAAPASGEVAGEPTLTRRIHSNSVIQSRELEPM